MTTPVSDTITLFGADWCRDCIRTKKQLDELGIEYTYVDLVEDPAAADVAKEISGRTNIPVVVYPDSSHHVEPSNADVEAKAARAVPDLTPSGARGAGLIRPPRAPIH